MTDEEVIDLLTFMASFDRRTVGRADVAAWKLAIGDLSFSDSQQAVLEHYRESREFAMPSDIRDRVKAIRMARLGATQLPDRPPSDPDEYRAWLRDERKKIADGNTGPRALESS